MLYRLFQIAHTYFRQKTLFKRYNALNMYDKETGIFMYTCFHIHLMDFSLSISQTAATILEIRVITSFMCFE